MTLYVVISFHLIVNISNRSEMDPEFKLPTGRRELKIGDSLKNNGTSFHGIKYDFKPSNEEFNESAVMEITPTNQVSLKNSRSDNEGASDFMYSGTMRQFPKEYFLVIDHVTGEVTLEKLTANIQLKRTKVVTKKVENQNYKKQELEKEYSMSPELSDSQSSSKKNRTKRKQKNNKNAISESQIVNKKYNLIPQHSPLHPSPSRTSPESKNQSCNNDFKSSRISPEASSSQRSLTSLDDEESSMTGFESKFPTLPELTNIPQQDNEFGLTTVQDMVGNISDSSSDSSSDSDSNSDSSSSSSSASSTKKGPQNRVNGYPLNGSMSPTTVLKGQILNEDLQLSETGSDSD